MTLNAVQALDALAAIEARESFYAFRQHISGKPKKGIALKKGWFVREYSNRLQKFYEDFIAGKRPQLIVEVPPQHGKSIGVIELIAWISGKHPELMHIFTSFSDRLGVRANLRLRRIFQSEKFKQVFPDFALDGTMNTSLIEFAGEGSFRNTTVLGSITGETLNLGYIDDPMKGRKEANSEVSRNNVWDWFTDDFFTRFDEFAGLLIVLTRWHIDDPAGRLIELDDTVERLRFPAIATQDEEYRKEGEVLFPEHKSLEFILKRKKVLGTANFEALYQQNPIIPEGNLINLGWFNRYDAIPANPDEIIISWDTAKKDKDINDPSVGLVAALYQGNIYIIDLVRGRFIFPELKRRVLSLNDKWSANVTLVEDAASGTSLEQDSRGKQGLNIILISTENKDKIARMDAESAAIEAGKVFLPNRAPWLSDFETEIVSFPNGVHDDQVDALSQLLKYIRKKETRSQPRIRGFD